MSEITCPECGQVSAITVIRRTADEFCTHCDYPLFWAPSSVPVAAGGPASDATLRRLPGAGGRMLIGTQVCPTCGELNPLAATHCIRCDTDFNPPPEPEPVVIDEPNRWWWWVLAAILFVIVTIVVVLIVT